MASHRKHVYFGLRSLFLSFGILLGGIAVHAQQAAVAPPSADAKPATDADFIAAADEVLGQMSQITGLKLVTPLKKSLRSREEIRAYVIKQMDEEKNPAERYAGERSAEAFGLLPKGFDLDAFMVNVLTEQVEGLYDPKTREFYIADWSPLADQRMVMAHELTHALEDQHFQIEAWVKAARPNEDAELARDAVLEGSAMAAMVDYLMLGTGRSLKDLPEFDPSMLIGDLGSTPTLQKAPPFLKDALIFPYLGGLTFSAAVMKNSGWSALPALFEKPPVSTQQILHPGLYRSGKTPVSVALPRLEKVFGDNWSKLDENIMGEFGWKEVLKQFLDNDRAKTLAAAWDGDRYVLYEHKQTKKLILVTRLHLDSEQRAARFFGQYSEAFEKKYSERTNLLRRPNFFSFDTPDGGVFLRCLGDECVTLEGTTRNIFDAFTKALNWPLAPQPLEKLGSVPAKTAMASAPGENIVAASGVGLSSQLPTEQYVLTLHAERQEASNRLFASNLPESSAGPRDIQKSAPQALSLCGAPPACGFGGDRILRLRDSVLPSNRRYIGTACHPEPVRADGQGSGCYRTSPEALPWNPLALPRHHGCEEREGGPR
jgi:hypothetical protein